MSRTWPTHKYLYGMFKRLWCYNRLCAILSLVIIYWFACVKIKWIFIWTWSLIRQPNSFHHFPATLFFISLSAPVQTKIRFFFLLFSMTFHIHASAPMKNPFFGQFISNGPSELKYSKLFILITCKRSLSWPCTIMISDKNVNHLLPPICLC